MAEYTGRVIGIISDPHGLLEPTEAALEDMASQGITEIYSLGDNIGEGPNPGEVLDLLKQYGVQSVAGNSEEYVTLGTTHFGYLGPIRRKSCLWTTSKLNEEQIGQIRLFPHTIELILGGKKLALVHFANDVRFDYNRHLGRGTWAYQARIDSGAPGYPQFDVTNSDANNEEIDKNLIEFERRLERLKNIYHNEYHYDEVNNMIDRIKYLLAMILNEPELSVRKQYFNEILDIVNDCEKKIGKDLHHHKESALREFRCINYFLPYLSAKVDPILFGHTVDMYDAIIQGHVHFKIYEESDSTRFYSVRAVGMAYGPEEPVDCASYLILRETTDGYEVEEKLVKYDREKMQAKIVSCTIPDHEKMGKFTEKRV